jgi:hypothetical protein
MTECSTRPSGPFPYVCSTKSFATLCLYMRHQVILHICLCMQHQVINNALDVYGSFSAWGTRVWQHSTFGVRGQGGQRVFAYQVVSFAGSNAHFLYAAPSNWVIHRGD